MVNWTVTATTMYCDSINGEVTIMVYKDGSAKCTAYNKQAKPVPQKRKPKCEGLECKQVTGYRDRLFAEESK